MIVSLFPVDSRTPYDSIEYLINGLVYRHENVVCQAPSSSHNIGNKEKKLTENTVAGNEIVICVNF